VGLRKNNVDVLNTNLRASRDRFDVGDLTVTDVAQSEARLSLAKSQLATAQGNLTASREAYRRVIGTWPDQLDQPPALPALPGSSDEAVAVALDNNPAIESATATTQAAQFDVRTARAARLPTFSAIGGSSYNDYLGTRGNQVGVPNAGLDQTQGQHNFGVSLNLPLYQGGLVGARVRQAQALEGQALEQSIGTERQVIASVRSAFAIYQAAGAAITANQQAVSANRLALTGVRAENSVGQRTVLNVLDAELELLNSQVALVTAQRDQYVAGFALLNAMGRAQAANLGLEGGPLYDPVANYSRVRNRIGDWSDNRRYDAIGTHTTGATPSDPDVAPYTPPNPAPVTSPRN
jgi:outer membrane protein